MTNKKNIQTLFYANLYIAGWIIIMLIAAVTLFWAAANEGKPVRPDPKPIQPLSERVQTSPEQLPSRSAEPEYREMFMEATAYSYTGSRTYTGTWPSRGTIAVDPDVILLGSKLWVEGYGYGIAEDTGGVVKGLKIDLFMETEDECWEWGRRMVKVKIFEQERMDKDED